MKKISLFIIIIAFFGSVCSYAVDAKPNKALNDILLGNTDKEIVRLLKAEKVFIHSQKVIADINDDGQDDLIVVATIVGPDRPKDAQGELSKYAEIGQNKKVSSDLMIISQIGNDEYYFLSYYIDPYGRSNAPIITLKDVNGDDKPEILLSMFDVNNPLSDTNMFSYSEGKLQRITFKGGILDGMTGVGAPTFIISKPSKLLVSYGPKNAIKDMYIWNDEGRFDFVNSNMKRPSAEQQEVIDYLKANITSILKAKPVLGAPSFIVSSISFFPDKRFISYFDDGHIMGAFVGKYNAKDKAAKIKYVGELIDVGKDSLDKFIIENKLPMDKGVTYINSKYGFIGSK